MKKVCLFFLGVMAAGLMGCYEIYTGTVSVTSVPQGAEISLDDSLTGQTTDCLLEEVLPGWHTIELTLDGYLDYVDSVEIMQDDTVEFTALFDTAATLVVTTQPEGADVYLNDSLTGEKTNCTIRKIPPGDYEVGLVLTGYKGIVDTCVLNPGQTDTVSWNFIQDREIFWTYTCPDEILYKANPALGHDGTIFFSATDNTSCILYAVDDAGNLRWKNTLQGGSFESNPSDPVIADDGTIYVGTESNLCAYTADGQFKWRYAVNGQSVSGKHPAPAIGSDGTIYFGSWDGRLYAFTTDGDTLWSFNAGNPIKTSPCISPNNTIYFSTDELLYSLAPDGDLNWNIPIESNTSPLAIGDDGTLYFGSQSSRFIYAYRTDGTLKWSFELISFVRNPQSIGTNGTIYVTCLEDTIYALNPDGTQNWIFNITEPGLPASTAVDSDGNILFGTSQATYSLRSDGTVNWKTDIGSNSSPLIAPDGTIYLLSDGNILLAIEGDAGLANSSWPRARANNQNTGRVQ